MNNTERTSIAFARWPLVVCLALLVTAPGWAQERHSQGEHEHGRFPHVVVFGTSLSDPGNAFALSGVAAEAPDFTMSDLLIPSAPYEKGGYHFSNGPTWVEQWARSVGERRSADAASGKATGGWARSGSARPRARAASARRDWPPPCRRGCGRAAPRARRA